MTKKKSKAKHECYEQVNAQLAEMNAELDTRISLNFQTGEASSRLALSLRKIDSKKRKSLPLVLCTFCPICGIKLDQ